MSDYLYENVPVSVKQGDGVILFQAVVDGVPFTFYALKGDSLASQLAEYRDAHPDEQPAQPQA
jgi:hypothetical protein